MQQEPSTSLFHITIDFSQSHTFFPTIIEWVLLILFLAIAALYGRGFVRQVASGQRSLSLFRENYDKLRFYGTIVLTVIYFLAMDYVGETFFPNTGLGFLTMSIPFIFVLSALYAHGLDRRKLTIIGLNAIIMPCAAWFVLAHLFRITLP